MDDYRYEGQELHLFEVATKWKRYLASSLKPHIEGKVLEVGAGIGETTLYLQNNAVKEWTCLEPDRKLLDILQNKIKTRKLPSYCTAQQGTIESLPPGSSFDTIIYIDVLEHIENDKREIEGATPFLKNGGSLIILAPANPVLYNPFDKAIGHHRRYSKKTLRMIVPSLNFKEIRLHYLDVASTLLLLLNRFFIKKKYPTRNDIWIWQTFFLPVSKILDGMFSGITGKSIVGIWRKY
ncbi:MAG TPA: class I SAM-dependent methyltransferase [Chitinophagaceae bacterium]|nr:class I SAM-dependent methyltransferase [Chitinophagaceae bacterium]